MLTGISVSVAIAVMALTTGAAEAAACGKRPDLVEALRQRHGEQPAQIALAQDGRVLEIWTREDGQWTLLATSPQGYACIQATGSTAWEMLPVGAPA